MSADPQAAGARSLVSDGDASEGLIAAADADTGGVSRERKPTAVSGTQPRTRPEGGFDPVDPVGTVLDGKYRIDGIIGQGSMGAVYRATHLTREAPVALKLVSEAARAAGPEILERFQREAVAASRLHTDHVVRIFDSGEADGGVPYLVMELLDGRDLDQLLAEGPLDVPRSVHVALQMLRALDVAHAAGVVHRDLKPSNLFLIERDGEPEHVKVLDFGISKLESFALTAKLTHEEQTMGTPLYMAPEQAENASTVGPAADIYAAGAVLYECLAGVPPLDADTTVEMLFKLLAEVPVRLDVRVPAVPAALADVVAGALAKDPLDRPRTAGAFAALLAPFADERSLRVLSSLRVSASMPPRPSLRPVMSSVPPPRRSSSVPAEKPPASVPRPPVELTIEPLIASRDNHVVPAVIIPARGAREASPSALATGTWAAIAIGSFVLTFLVGLWLLAWWRPG